VNPIGGDATLTGTFAVLRAFLPLSRLVPARIARTWVRRELLRWYHDPARGRGSVDQYLRALAPSGRWSSFLRQLRALDGAEAAARTRALQGIGIPVALLVGSDDPAIPQAAIDSLRGVLPQATLDIVRDGHHFSPEESPEQVARVIARLVGA
jgi:pimeloyl-ACP methyl ester carboxylesterase